MGPSARKRRQKRTEETRPNFYDAVYRVVRKIPRGRVMTYGQIATILGAPRAARAVGYAMRASPKKVPWQRVINRMGQISARGDVERPIIQQQMLEAEGVVFDDTESCDLGRYRWEPRNPEQFFFDPSEQVPF
ncbi:MAG: methylated-DNA--[protein]-cysteine S-methyltransferase [Candidatus Hydrogenedentes bacterium]|nr:methylated-DNA--[protein]-cysteine S-methyltransferase [Candidatus Hydrogenedentota bacterium]